MSEQGNNIQFVTKAFNNVAIQWNSNLERKRFTVEKEKEEVDSKIKKGNKDKKFNSYQFLDTAEEQLSKVILNKDGGVYSFELPTEYLKLQMEKEFQDKKEILNQRHPCLCISKIWSRKDFHINNCHLGLMINNEVLK